jgi:hypothetical protein
MIIPERDPNSLIRTRTLSEIAGQDYSPTDYGVVEGLKATSLATIERNFTVTAADWVKQYDERRDMKMGKYAPVTQEEFDASPAAKYGLEFRSNENPYSFQRRIQKSAKLSYYDEMARGQDRQASQLVASLGVGLVTDPANFIGVGLGANVAKGSLYAAAGRAKAAAYHTTKGTFKNTLAYGAAFEVPYAFMSNDLGVEEYTVDHLQMSMAMNGVFSTLLSAGTGTLAYRSAAKVRKAKADYDAYNSMMTGDYTMPQTLESVYASGDKAIARVIRENKRLSDVAEGRVVADEMTLEDTFLVASVLKAHETNLKMTTMASKMADDFLAQVNSGEVGIFKARKEYEARVKRVGDAVLFGKVQNLTDVDVEFITENGIQIRKRGDAVDQNGGSAQLHPEYTLTEDYGVVTNAESSANQSLIEASYKAQKLEQRYFQLLKKAEDAHRLDGYSTKQEALEHAALLKKQAEELKPKVDSAIGAVDNVIGETYARIVEDANSMVNDVFFGEKIIPATIRRKEFVDEYNAIAWVVDNELRNYISQPHTLFYLSEHTSQHIPDAKIPASELLFTRVLSAMFHESWHIVQELDPNAYNKLLDIAKSRKIKKALDEILEKRGYYSHPWYKEKDAFTEEAGSHLLEFALAQPEFWIQLNKTDSTLAGKYKLMVNNLLSYAASVLKVDGFESLLSLRKPESVAKRVAKVIATLRENVDQIKRIKKIKDQLGGWRNRSLNISKKTAYDNPNFKSRAEEMRKYSADPVKYLEDTIESMLGDEQAMPELLPNQLPETAADLNEYIATTVVKLDKMGLGHITPYVKDSLVNQIGSQKRRIAIMKVIRKGDPTEDVIGALLKNLKDKKAPLDLVQRIGFILKDEDLSMTEKLGKVNRYFHEENLAMILRNVHNATVARNLKAAVDAKKTPKEKMDQLKTMLDGSLREGVQRNTSIQRAVDAQIIKDQSPLIEYLVNNDLLEVFLGEDPTHYMSSYRELVAKNPEVARIYGENLKEGSLQLHLDLMDSISSGAIPLKWKDVEEFQGLVDIIKTINLGQMAEINHLGVNMRQRKGFTGYSMRYDRQVVSAMSEKEFVSFMLGVVDAETTERLHGGVMEGRRTTTLPVETRKAKSGKQEARTFDTFEIKEFLSRFYGEIVSGRFEEEDTAAAKSIIGSMRKAAKIAFKPEHRNEAMIKLSNFENLGRLLLEQIRNRSEKIASVKNLGHDPYGMVMGVARNAGLAKVKGFDILDATAKQVTGMLDNPVDVDIANNFQKVRQFSNVLFLAGSGISALSDIPLMLTTLQYLGNDVTFKDFVASYRQAADAQFRGNNKQKAAWFRSQGAGFDIITRQTAQRVVTGESYAGGLLGAANQLMFELNGLNRITATHQQVFLDLITNSIGHQLRTGDINPVLKSRMLEFGFTEKEISALAKYVVKTPDGKYRLGSSNIKNAPLQRKLSGFYMTYMKEAVIEPDAGAMAISRLGLEAGTITGETARVALQYSSFMLAMSRVVYRRFLHGYSGEGKHNAYKMAHLITYVGTALAFAYMSTVLKDLSRAKEPINPLNMTFFDFSRILRQSGVLGVAELGLNAAQFGPTSTLSPIAETAVDVVSGDVAGGLKPLTGQQYPIIGPVLQKAIGFVMGETVQNVQNDLVDRAVQAERQGRYD